MSMFNRNILALLILCGVAAVTIGCGNSIPGLQNGSSEERFREGMRKLDEEEYEQARQLFEVIVLQDPASEYADDAQFYLAETYFRNEEYKLAAFNYNQLRQSFPNSPFYKDAMFRAGESYYFSSLPYDRDQRDTRFAIQQYNNFARVYPKDSLTTLAQGRIREMTNKLAQKDYMTAMQYVDLDDYEAALVYFNRVIDLYPETDYAPLAKTGKEDALRKLN